MPLQNDFFFVFLQTIKVINTSTRQPSWLADIKIDFSLSCFLLP